MVSHRKYFKQNFKRDNMNMKISKKKLINIVLLLSLSYLFYIIPYIMHHYPVPIGWDTPHYIQKSKALEAYGVSYVTQYDFRIGYSMLLSVTSIITGVSNIKIDIYLILLLGSVLALLFANLVYSFRKSILLFNIIFLFEMVSFNNIRIIQDLHDNLFALIGVICAFSLISKIKYNNLKIPILMIILLVSAGLTHLETFVLFITIVFSFSMIDFIEHAYSIKNKKYNKNPTFLVLWLILCISTILVLFVWKDVLFGFISVSTRMMAGVVAAEVAAETAQRTVPSLPIPHVGIMAMFFIIGLFEIFSKRSTLNKLLVSWILIDSSLYFGYLFGILIPHWRLSLIFPVPILAGIGAYRLFLVCKFINIRKIIIKRFIAYIILLIILSVIFINGSSTNEYWSSRPIWISPNTIDELIIVNNDILNSNDNSSIIFIINPKGDPWGTANMKYAWILAFMPKEKIKDTYIYYGRPIYYIHNSPTVTGDKKYDSVSIYYYNILSRKNISNARVYLLKSLNEYTTYKNIINRSTAVEIGDGVLLLKTINYFILENIRGSKKSGIWYFNEKYGLYESHYTKGSNLEPLDVHYSFYLWDNMNVTVQIKYMDGSKGTPPTYVEIDNSHKYKLNFTETRSIKTKNIQLFMQKGMHTLKIKVDKPAYGIAIRFKEVSILLNTK